MGDSLAPRFAVSAAGGPDGAAVGRSATICAMDADRLDEAIRQGDLDELLRVIDRCCEDRDWESLAELEARCERAHESGRQLWPAASHAAYRLALEAPPPFAASVLREGTGRFAPGPLPEVAAQSHTWTELAPHVAAGPDAVLAAHERVVRGEDVSTAPPRGPAVIELPLALASWEPEYALAQYDAHRAEFPSPALPRLAPVDLPTTVTRTAPDDGVAALLDVTRTWTQDSNGTGVAIAVDGAALAAIAALGVPDARAAPIESADAFALLAWAGASGGAHGRRRGGAAGRFSAWWSAAALLGLLDVWPPDPAVLGDALDDLRWFAWDAGEPATGWQLHLAVEHARSGRAWAVAATDAT